MPTYLIRLAQAHESFRKVELQALADLAGVKLEFVKYEEDVCRISFSSHAGYAIQDSVPSQCSHYFFVHATYF